MVNLKITFHRGTPFVVRAKRIALQIDNPSRLAKKLDLSESQKRILACISDENYVLEIAPDGAVIFTSFEK